MDNLENKIALGEFRRRRIEKKFHDDYKNLEDEDLTITY